MVEEHIKDIEKDLKKVAEDNIMDIAELFFMIHKIGIIVGNFGWIFIPKILYFQFIVILSWKLNNNRCIISQVEYYLFDRTFMGEGQKFYVPRHQRYLLYTNFGFGACYYLLNY